MKDKFMRIGIDGTAVWGPPVGQYTYMAYLIKYLLELNRHHDFTVFCRRKIPVEFESLSSKAKFKVCKFKNRKICEQLCIPLFSATEKVDLIHNCWTHPFLHKGKSVVTIHGLEWRTHPDIPLHSGVNTLYYRSTVERSSRRATRLIAISEFIKNAFVEHMAIPEEKIDVVYHGVDLDIYHKVRDTACLDRIKKHYGLPERFILFVGALVANKNLTRLVHALHRIRQESTLGDVGLVIVGVQAWNSASLQEMVHGLGLNDNVVFTGHVPQKDISALYSLADIYAFPSLVEGFGLPILEAFACETPVITSNVTAMPEVAGDAALLVDPLQTDEIADALSRLLRDSSLRRRLVTRGLARAKRFTWERTARKTLEVYERALNS